MIRGDTHRIIYNYVGGCYLLQGRDSDALHVNGGDPPLRGQRRGKFYVERNDCIHITLQRLSAVTKGKTYNRREPQEKLRAAAALSFS